MMMMTTLEYDEIKPHKVTYCQEKAKKERRRYLRWISKNLNHPKKHLSPSTYWVRFIDNNVPHIKNLCVNYAKNCEYENALFSSVYRRLCYDRKKVLLSHLVIKWVTKWTWAHQLAYVSRTDKRNAHKNAWNACLSNEIFNNIINFSSYIHENTLHYGIYFGCSLHRTSFIQ